MTRQDIKSAKDVEWFIQACIDSTVIEFSDDGNNWIRDMAHGFILKTTFPFGSWDDEWYKMARPISEPKTERRMMEPVKLLQYFEDNGYRRTSVGYENESYILRFDQLRFCGRPAIEVSGGGNCAIEEKEDYNLSIPIEWTELVEVTE